MATANTVAAAEQENGGIGMRQAVEIARAFIHDTYPHGLESLQLEEIDRTEDDAHWLLTFGFVRQEPPHTPQAFSIVPTPEVGDRTRLYKTVMVAARSGEVRSMKIRVP